MAQIYQKAKNCQNFNVAQAAPVKKFVKMDKISKWPKLLEWPKMVKIPK